MLLAWCWVDPQYRISPHRGCLGNFMHLMCKDRHYLYKHTYIYLYLYTKKKKRKEKEKKKKKAGKTEHTKPETQCTWVQTTQLYLRIWILLKFTYNYLWSEKSKSVLKVMMYTSRQTMKTKAGEILGYSYWNRIEYSK